MIPAVKAKLLEGKRGLVVGIANENSIAWGCAKAFRAFGAEVGVTYLNDKAKKFVEPLAQALEAPIVMPLDARVAGQMEAVFETRCRTMGHSGFPRALDRVFTEGRDPRSCRGRFERRFFDDDGRFLLDVHPHGAFGGAAYAQRRHAFYHDLLWQPDGR
jgi:hypothetical protein